MYNFAKLQILLVLLVLNSCQQYKSNVEVIYKNSEGPSYRNSGTDVLKNDTYPQEQVEKIDYQSPIKKTQKTESYNPPVENRVLPSNKNTEINDLEKSSPALERGIASDGNKPMIAKSTSLATINSSDNPSQVNLNKNEETYHIVQKGETYYSISRLYFVQPEKVMKLNGATEKTILKPGTIIKINGETNVARAEPIKINSEAGITRAEPIKITPANNPKPLAVSESKTLHIVGGSSSCGEKFILPIASKKIINQFDAKLDGGVKSDGIVFETLKEENIFASNNGEVAYVGDGFSDYGKILIIKHKNSYFSIYGYLKTLDGLIKGQIIKKGDKLSLTSTKEGKFYFSIRKGKVAVNPSKCL